MNKKNHSPRADYDVGYGKPPKHTQFKKGQSGNKRGGSKRVHDINTLIVEELAKPITVRVGSEERMITKQHAIIMAMVNQAIKGEMRAISLLLPLARALQDAAASQRAAAEFTKDDRDFVDLLVQYMKQQGKVPWDSSD